MKNGIFEVGDEIVCVRGHPSGHYMRDDTGVVTYSTLNDENSVKVVCDRLCGVPPRGRDFVFMGHKDMRLRESDKPPEKRGRMLMLD